MKKIVILGDSLGLPRIDLPYESTYPFLLQEVLNGKYRVIARNIRANDTSVQLKNLFDDVGLFKPDIVILQLGIVDCAPRLFWRFEAKIVGYIDKYINIISIISRFRYPLTKVFPKVYVSKKSFKNNLVNIFYYLEERQIKVIVVGITSTTPCNMEKSFNYDNNIRDYNNMLYNLIPDKRLFIDMYKHGSNILLQDGIHLNIIGSKILSDEIAQKLSI